MMMMMTITQVQVRLRSALRQAVPVIVIKRLPADIVQEVHQVKVQVPHLEATRLLQAEEAAAVQVEAEEAAAVQAAPVEAQEEVATQVEAVQVLHRVAV